MSSAVVPDAIQNTPNEQRSERKCHRAERRAKDH